ncbi:LamG-like jellyroll fold domain-containing protein [Enterococcus sp. BWR-S5]|uniref:LamG-like jellyroll fold domain-containing protein n=1 Tax=Enterococcus sp. BWR-S5 TaxID=2787714 RepID=UPI0019220026|nr:LamG-like jellyroll fold domain-containing protein [Enterococcus sp. BWR-S5]MBL1227128.1 ADP-ribosylglycohydrolase family protein [Enterococcus sp. BWR-S5]
MIKTELARLLGLGGIAAVLVCGSFLGTEGHAENKVNQGVGVRTNTNLIKNGDFEDGTAHWDIKNVTCNGVDTYMAYGGVGQKLWFYNSNTYTGEVSQTVENIENGVYVVSAMVQHQLNQAEASELRIDLFDGKQNSVALNYNPNYQYVTTEVTVVNGKIKLGFYQKGRNATLHVDNVTLEKKKTENELLAYWDFDQVANGKITDLTGNGFDGTTKNGAGFQDGIFGESLSLNGSNQYMEVPHSAHLSFSSKDSYTIAAWVKVSENNKNWETIIQKGRDTSSFYGLWVEDKNDTFAFGRPNISATQSIEDWVHLTAVQHGDISREFFVNGKPISKGDAVDSLSGSSLLIGASKHTHNGALTEFFNGAIDETRIYNYALSQAEVNVLQNREYTPETAALRFNVTPSDATVTLRGKDGEVLSSSAHVYTQVPQGFYTYSIEKEGYESIRGEIDFVASAKDKTIQGNLTKLSAENTLISQEEVTDRIKGGWAGQMSGVAWGASTEFNYKRVLIPDSHQPQWNGISNAFTQDDLYVEIPFLESMKNSGVNVRSQIIGDYFSNTAFPLWHGNRVARYNLRQRNIDALQSGHYSNMYDAIPGDKYETVDGYNTSQSSLIGCAEDIDFQIESDALGMMSVGQPNVAKELAYRFGHVISYGGGVYGGVFTSVMYAKAFTADSVEEIVLAGMEAIPHDTETREILEDVYHWYKRNRSLTQTWTMLEERWHNDRCTHLHANSNDSAGNIDAKLASAYILMGLLYGEGDFEDSMWLSMKCGQDSDCTPSSVGGILGTYYGFNNIPIKWTDSLNMNTKFSNTDYTFNGAVALNTELALEALEMSGGKSIDEQWTIPATTTNKELILEKWPEKENECPVFQFANAMLAATDPSGRTFTFNAEATDSDGITNYQWFFGDLSFETGKSLTHTYKADGTYYPVCYVTDAIGNTNVYEFKLEVNGNNKQPVAHWDFDQLTNGIVKDVSGNGHDGQLVGGNSVAGKIGQALQLNGSQYVKVPHDEQLNLSKSQNYTISAWIKHSGSGNTWQTLLQKGRETANYYGLWVAPYDIYNLGTKSFNLAITKGFNRNEWNLLTAVYDWDEKVYTLYLNGTQVSTKSVSAGAIGVSKSDLLIGSSGSINQLYSGQVDDIRLYKTSLSAAEVMQLYTGNK